MKNSRTLQYVTALVLLPVLAVADDTAAKDEVVVDEIIVTADFRGRSLGEMPASVMVMDAAFISEAAVQHFEELVNAVPNLNWSGDGHRVRYLQIRGVGELEQYQGAPNPSIGFLIDDIDFSGIGTVATLFDMQSVEVLRGSQGSRYGANALGGLVYMRSAMPSSERGGRLQLGVADDAARSLGIAFGGLLPNADAATFRLSGHRYESNGFRRNAFLNRDDTNGRDETTVRARARFESGESLEANFALMYTDIDNGYDAFSLDSGYSTLSDKPGGDAQESIGGSMRLDWSEFSYGSLTAITAFAVSDIAFGFDADWGNDDSWAPVRYDYTSANDRKRLSVSQELRYASKSWLYGLYALRLEDDLDSLNVGDYFDPGYNFADALNYPFMSRYESTNVAAFAQYTTPLTETMEFSAGLRIERRNADYDDSDGLSASPTEDLWGGELSLNYGFSESVSAYVTAARGYKAGGFNLGPVPDEWRQFSDEAVWTLETGIKSSLLDGTLFANASVFNMWREDQQARASFQLVPNDPASFGFATVNIDGGRNHGAEVDLRWQPTGEFDVYLSAGALFGGFPDLVAPFPWLNGRDQAHASRYTLSAGLAYTHTNGFFVRVDGTARAAFYFDVSHNQESKPYELLHARVGFEKEDWLVTLWGRNLTDRDYTVRGFFFGNEPPDFPPTLYTRLGDPRQIGLTIERRF